MKREWYEYAVSYQKRIQRLQGKSLVPAAVAANVLIGIFLLPVFFTKLWLGLLLIGTYIPLFINGLPREGFLRQAGVVSRNGVALFLRRIDLCDAKLRLQNALRFWRACEPSQM